MRPKAFMFQRPRPLGDEPDRRRFVEQVIRPTGLVDPVCDIRPAKSQVDDLISECHEAVKKNHRVLVTTLTKRWRKI